ncbi:nitroreductase family protein [Amycolatopsis alkalitolerans]|nr:nitroreductase family protein [Amycolatopsis alkalitolerans]
MTSQAPAGVPDSSTPFAPELPLPQRMDVLEAMRTQVAMRWFTEEPVTHEQLMTVLWAATRAPSPGNTQGWDFLVVTEPELKRKIRDAIVPLREKLEAVTDTPPGRQKLRAGSLNLMAHLDKLPVLIFVCGKPVFPADNPRLDMMYSALYGATQNLMLAARAVGLATVMTTLHSAFEPVIRPMLGVPDDIHLASMIPVGRPARPHTAVKRKPVEDFVHWNTWA